jgi:alpha-tubulin suppressor-like RCC1 family protein
MRTNRAPTAGNADCDDTNPIRNPGAAEVCDGAMVDENCDGMANPSSLCACSGSAMQSCPLPGACAAGTETCVAGSWGSCSITPQAESCNGIDDNCNGMTDEGLTVTCYPDTDNDGYAATGAMASPRCPVSGREAVGGCPTNQTNRAPTGSNVDCNDTNAAISPSAPELCDAAMVDENCDGMANPSSLCACSGTATRMCPLGGACAAGTQSCSSGSWGSCSILPVSEICNGVDDNCNGMADEGLTVTCFPDNDNDGYAAMGALATQSCPVAGRSAVGGCPTNLTNRAPTMGNVDCNDNVASVNPGAPELCDAAMADENCDGVANPAATCACSGSATRPCPQPGACAAGTQMCASGSWGSCSIVPVAEVCNGLDDNCNGSTDEMLTVTCYPDADNDGFAAMAAPASLVCPVTGRTSVGGCPTNTTNRAPTMSNVDCNDADATVNPAAPELCDAAMRDENCDGTANPSSLCACSGSATRACTLPGACAAGTQTCTSGSWGSCSISPVAESCNAIDDNCNGSTDEGLTITCYPDADNDTYAPMAAMGTAVCPVTGRAFVGGCPTNTTNRAPSAGNVDCNDMNAGINPGAAETCDAAMVDENCDGVANPSMLCACSGSAMRSCPLPGACAAGNQTCSSGSWGACSISPVAESCNGIDDNCNGSTDEGLTVMCYPDVDNDTYAPMASTATAVCPVTGRAAVGGCPTNMTNRQPSAGNADCNDMNPSINPGSVEVCDAAMVDENCDGMANPAALCACSGSATRPCPLPGACAAGSQTCSSGSWGACSISPVGESCNGIDDNCNGSTDEGLTISCYADADNDTYPPMGATPSSVCPVTGRGFVGGCPTNTTNRPPGAGATDCADMNAAINPGATEVCDMAMVDENCDGMANPASLCACSGSTTRPCPLPGACAAGTQTCSSGAWGACSISPVTESCNGIDDNCNGTTDEGLTVTCYTDNDNDGYSPSGATPVQVCPAAGRSAVGGCPTSLTNRSPATPDCIDSNAARNPGAVEACNGIDDDCDGMVDEGVLGTFWPDVDGDGYGNAAGTSVQACTTPIGYAPNSTDCDDTTRNRRPGLTETCDGLDNDCNGTVDDPAVTDPTCAVAGAYAACRGGQCITIACSALHGDCDGNRTNGCEANFQNDPANCGGCGISCGGGPCIQGRCDGVTQIAAGYGHTCAVRQSGYVSCWGFNSWGQLGDGTNFDRATPVLVSGITTAVQVAASYETTCARLAGGSIMCWGHGGYGELGNGVVSATTTPVAVSGLNDAVDITAGGFHFCARRSTGAVVCWGLNDSGQIGDATMNNALSPTTVTGLAGMTVLELSAGDNFTCARISGGTVRCWGNNTLGQIGDGTTTSPRLAPTLVAGLANAAGLASNIDGTCARTTSNTVVCWGVNSSGECGDGTVVSPRVNIVTATGVTTVAEVAADGAGHHVCARRADGSVLCWGQGLQGQLGNGGTSNSSTAVVVSGIGGANPGAVQIAAGAYHACALRSDGQVLCWGGNSNGQLGDGTGLNRPNAVMTTGLVNSSIVEVAPGGAHTCARRASGTVTCWGLNGSGQLGDNTTVNRLAPVSVSGLVDAVEIVAGAEHTCARQSAGTIVCWGKNANGQLGDGTSVNRLVPTAVSGISDAIALAAGRAHTCALRQSGAIVCWGDASTGQAGDGTTTGRLAPGAQVAGITTAVDIASRFDHTCARLTSGGMACWGSDIYAQCGAGGAASYRLSPVNVVGINDALQIGTGADSSCVLRANNTVSCWGNNNYGEVGDGGPSSARTSPSMVAGLTDAAALSVGYEQACVRRASGALACWGFNLTGAIGDGSYSTRPTPSTVMGITDATFVATGGYQNSGAITHSCAIRATGVIDCWGTNGSGQLGNGTTTGSPLPVQVSGLP